MTTKEKIKYYIDSKGISKNKFYTITGLSTSFLDSGNTIGVDKAKIIIEKFPDLSLEWLVLDRGPMLANNKVPEEKNDKNSERIDKLLDIVASQQKTIELLAQKGAAADVQGVAGNTDTRLSDQRRGPASQPRHDRHDKTDYKTGYIIVSRFRRIIQCYG